MGMKADTSRGQSVRQYYLDLEHLIFQYGKQQFAELQEKSRLQLEKAQLEMNLLRIENEDLRNNGIPRSYIFRKDQVNDIGEMKLGITRKITLRCNPYYQTNPNGRMCFSVQLPEHDMRKTEA